MKKPGRGTNGHIAIACNNVDRAIYHLSQRGVKFDLDSKKCQRNGKDLSPRYFADEIAGFAMHLVHGLSSCAFPRRFPPHRSTLRRVI